MKKVNSDVRKIKEQRSNAGPSNQEYNFKSENKPERLKNIEGKTDASVIEAIKWEIEVHEKKNEDRFR